jgi:hypothetical protein
LKGTKANIAVKLLSFLPTNNGKPKRVHQEKIRLIKTGALAKSFSGYTQK